MKLARHHRSLLAWTLYACVLFNALACSLGHAQSAGLQLSGLDSLFCSVNDSAATDSADDSQSGLPSSPSCALGSTITLSLGLLLGLSWLLRRGHEHLPPRSPERQLTPRIAWPSANPRASPALSC